MYNYFLILASFGNWSKVGLEKLIIQVMPSVTCSSGFKCISYLLYSISDSVKFVIQIARQKKKIFRLINQISFSFFFFLHMTCTHLVNANLKLAKFWMEWNTKELSLQAFSTLNSHYCNDTFLITFRNLVGSENDTFLLL